MRFPAPFVLGLMEMHCGGGIIQFHPESVTGGIDIGAPSCFNGCNECSRRSKILPIRTYTFPATTAHHENISVSY